MKASLSSSSGTLPLALILLLLPIRASAYELLDNPPTPAPAGGVEFSLHRSSFGADSAIAERAVIMALEAWKSFGNLDLDLSLSSADVTGGPPMWAFENRYDGVHTIYYGRVGADPDQWHQICRTFDPEIGGVWGYAATKRLPGDPYTCDIVICGYDNDRSQNAWRPHLV